MTNALDLISALRAEIQKAPISDLPAVIGDLEALKTEALARLITPLVSSGIRTDSPQLDHADRLLKVDEAAQMLGMKPSWVRRHQGELPLVNLPGRAVRFSAKRLELFIKRRSYT